MLLRMPMGRCALLGLPSWLASSSKLGASSPRQQATSSRAFSPMHSSQATNSLLRSRRVFSSLRSSLLHSMGRVCITLLLGAPLPLALMLVGTS